MTVYLWKPGTKSIEVIECHRLTVDDATQLGVEGQLVDTSYMTTDSRMRYGTFIKGTTNALWVHGSLEGLDPEFRTQLLLLGVT